MNNHLVTTRRCSFTLALLAALTSASFSLGCADVASDDDAEATDQATEALNNGTSTTTLFPEVVRIQISIDSNTIGLCSATAIADDLLLTAAHCVKKDGVDVADNVKVVVANGDNAGASNAYSSYIVMSSDVYDNLDTSGTDNYYARDFALIKFGRNTFSKYLSFTYKTNLVSTGSTLTNIGFGDSTTKEYGTTTVSYLSSATSSTGYGFIETQSNSSVAGQGITEHGDSGGPLLYQSGGQYYVVGVLNGNSTSGTTTTSAYAALTPAVYNHISTLLTSRSKYCVEGFQDINYGGDSYSFCFDSAVTSDLAAQGFSDPFAMYRKWYYNYWNDKISSLQIPDDVSVTLYHDYSNGQGTGSSVTFVNAFSFLDTSNISSMVDYSFNDVASAFSMVYTSSPTVYFKTSNGKCLDVAGGGTTNGTVIQQWDCGSPNTNQEFTLLSTGTTDVYQLENATSGKCVNVSGGSSDNGTQIQQWDCDANNTDNLWKLEALSNKSQFHLVNPKTGKCLDLSQGSSSNGAKIQLWECLSTSSSYINDQLFSFRGSW